MPATVSALSVRSASRSVPNSAASRAASVERSRRSPSTGMASAAARTAYRPATKAVTVAPVIPTAAFMASVNAAPPRRPMSMRRPRSPSVMLRGRCERIAGRRRIAPRMSALSRPRHAATVSGVKLRRAMAVAT